MRATVYSEKQAMLAVWSPYSASRSTDTLSKNSSTRAPAGALGVAEDLAVEDRVPGVGVRRPAAPSFGDLA